MKKMFIAALVGAIIVFAWQAISHMALNNVLHKSMSHTPPNGEQVLAAMQGAETGMYMYPGEVKGESWDDAVKRMQGKPGVFIMYDKSMNMNMGMPMVIGFILDFLGVWIVVSMLGYARERLKTSWDRWWAVMLFALFLIIMQYLMGWNWFGYPFSHVLEEGVDTLITWALCGLWLSWYLGRNMTKAPAA